MFSCHFGHAIHSHRVSPDSLCQRLIPKKNVKSRFISCSTLNLAFSFGGGIVNTDISGGEI